MAKRNMDRRSFLTQAVAGGALVGLGAQGLAAAEKKCAATEKCAAEDGWKPLFNGKDLCGWKAEGKASWSVKDKMLIGRQGENGAPGDLFTEKIFADFEVVLEYKIDWPANSGLWFRYQTPEKAYQADILEYKNPVAWSGTLYCPGRMFLAVNEDEKIVNREDWNTMKVKAQGDHLVITLNGKVVGDVKDDALKDGRLGFQIHAGDEFNNMQLTVRKMMIREL